MVKCWVSEQYGVLTSTHVQWLSLLVPSSTDWCISGNERWKVDDVQNLLFTTLQRALRAMVFVPIAWRRVLLCALTAVRFTLMRWNHNRERPIIISSLSMVRIVIYRSCLAGRVTQTRKRMRFFAVEWLTLPYSMDRFRVLDHVIVLRLRRNSSPSLTRIATLSSSSQRA